MGDKPKIITVSEYTPWGLEWSAFRADFDGGSFFDKNAAFDGDKIGWGKTPEEATADLIEQEEG